MGKKAGRTKNGKGNNIFIFRKVEAHINFDNHEEICRHSVRVTEITNSRPKIKEMKEGAYLDLNEGSKSIEFNFKLLKRTSFY